MKPFWFAVLFVGFLYQSGFSQEGLEGEAEEELQEEELEEGAVPASGKVNINNSEHAAEITDTIQAMINPDTLAEAESNGGLVEKVDTNRVDSVQVLKDSNSVQDSSATTLYEVLDSNSTTSVILENMGDSLNAEARRDSADSVSLKKESSDAVLEVGEETPPRAVETIGSDFVIEVDTTQSKNVGRSLPLALALSAVVPGGGELYLREKKTAKIFSLIEVGFWTGLFFSWMAHESYLQSAKNTAALLAGVDAEDVDEEFLAAMTQYRSYEEIHHRKDSYVQAQILSGTRDGNYDIAAEEENYWDFGTPLVESNTDNWNTFINSTKAYGRAKVVMTWAVGGLILGRVVSVLNSLHVYRKTAVEGFSEAPASQKKSKALATLNWKLIPIVTPGGAEAHLRIQF